MPVGLFRPFFTLRSRLCSGLLVSILHPLAVQAGHWSVPVSAAQFWLGLAGSGHFCSVGSCLVLSGPLSLWSGLAWPVHRPVLVYPVRFKPVQHCRSSPVHWQPCSIRGPAEPARLGSGRRQSSSVLASADRLGSSALLCPALILLLMVNP